MVDQGGGVASPETVLLAGNKTRTPERQRGGGWRIEDRGKRIEGEGEGEGAKVETKKDTRMESEQREGAKTERRIGWSCSAHGGTHSCLKRACDLRWRT